MLQEIYPYIFTLFCTLLLHSLADFSFPLVPDLWFCDYDEPLHIFPEKNLYLFFDSTKKASFLAWLFLIFFSYFSYKGIYDIPILTPWRTNDPDPWCLICYAFLSLIFMHIIISDLTFSLIPDQYTLSIVIITVLYAARSSLLYHDFTFILRLFYGASAGFFPLFLLVFTSYITKKKAPVGFGDIKLFAALGALLGIESILSLYVYTFFISGSFIAFRLTYLKAYCTLFSRPFVPPEAMPMAPYIFASLILIGA